MPTLKNYHLLISHSWGYSEQYDRVKKWLDEATNFKWSNHSVTADKPFDTTTDRELKCRLTNQMNGCHAVIIISGMYATYSKWIDYEIDEAIRLDKPIIALKPWGHERIPLKISNNADVLVNWNGESLCRAVRDYAK